MNYLCQYKKGATITIFAPYDCGNRCPFCVNKKDYLLDKSFNLEKVCQSLYALHDITPFCDIVITGGEPFADLDKLQILVQAVVMLNQENKNDDVPTHKLFINTTLPSNTGDIVGFIEQFRDTITGLNVSRHVRPYVAECADSIFEELEGIVPVRINTVLAHHLEAYSYMEKVYDRYKGYSAIKGFQVREDYTTVDTMNLYSYSSIMKDFLFGNFGIGDNEIDTFFKKNLIFGNDFRWNLKITDKISYHKTLPYSTIYCGNTNKEINDIIINPRGKILDDWNDYGRELDLDLYAKRILRPVNQG